MNQFPSRTMIPLALSIGLLGCSEPESARQDSTTIEVELVGSGGLSSEPPVETTQVNLSGSVTGLEGVGWDVFVGTDEGVFVLNDSRGAVTLEVVEAEWGEAPLSALSMTADLETAVISTDKGLVHSQGALLLASPLSDPIGELLIEDMAIGSQGELWIAANDGLYRAGPTELVSVDYGSEAPPTHVAFHDGRVLVAGQKSARIIDVESWSVQTLQLTGSVLDLGSRSGGFMLGCDDGLIVESDDTWTRYPITTGGAARASAVTGREDRVVTATSAGLVEWRDGDLRRLSEDTDLGHIEHITLDQHGHVWTSQGSEAIQWRAGNPPSFEEDIAPFFVSKCDWCHMSASAGAPQRDFKNYEIVVALLEPIIERIALGSMPPPEVGMTTTEEELELLARWIDGGLEP